MTHGTFQKGKAPSLHTFRMCVISIYLTKSPKEFPRQDSNEQTSSPGWEALLLVLTFQASVLDAERWFPSVAEKGQDGFSHHRFLVLPTAPCCRLIAVGNAARPAQLIPTTCLFSSVGSQVT